MVLGGATGCRATGAPLGAVWVGKAGGGGGSAAGLEVVLVLVVVRGVRRARGFVGLVVGAGASDTSGSVVGAVAELEEGAESVAGREVFRRRRVVESEGVPPAGCVVSLAALHVERGSCHLVDVRKRYWAAGGLRGEPKAREARCIGRDVNPSVRIAGQRCSCDCCEVLHLSTLWAMPRIVMLPEAVSAKHSSGVASSLQQSHQRVHCV